MRIAQQVKQPSAPPQHSRYSREAHRVEAGCVGDCPGCIDGPLVIDRRRKVAL